MIPSAATAYYLALAALAAAAPADSLSDSVVEVKRFSFEAEDDEDYDNQPDEWTRRRGASFPHYVQAIIDRKVAAHGKYSLRFDLNGGQAVYYSPLIPVDDAHSYVLRGKVRTEGLQHDAALVSVSLLDHRRRRVQRVLGRPVMGTNRDWVSLQIGPLRPRSDVRFLVIGCHVAEGDKGDIRGHVWFDDLWLGGLPRLELTTASGQHYFKSGETIGIAAEVVGLAPMQTYRLAMSLEDEAGKRLEEKKVEILQPAPAQDQPGSERRKPLPWPLPQQRNGFYRVRAVVERDQVRILEKETTFVVMDPDETQSPGEFGWSVSVGPGELKLAELAQVASRSGINWLKLPLWSAVHREQKNKSTEIARFMEQLEQDGITLVGLLNDPPPQLTEKFAQNWVGVSKIFTLPRDFWYPSLEPIIARYSFRIRHWQLGGEEDDSFIGLQTLPQTISAVKKEFDRIGHDSRLGFHWDWKQPLPKAVAAPHSFLSLSARASLDAGQLEEALLASEKAGIPRWVLLKPLAQSQHAIEVRTMDLTRRMVAAKVGKAEAVFVADPFDAQSGMLNPDGSPTELFLPWRTMALALRGATYLGRFELPQHSPNALFARKNEMVMVVWNDQPSREEFFLGEQAYVTDLWGHRLPNAIDAVSKCHTLDVGPAPLIVRGCSVPIAQWRLAARFEKGRIGSEYGGHEDALLLTNTFPQGVSGKAELHMPPGWEVEPNRWPFQLGKGENVRLPTVLTFPPDASLGKLRPTIDFELSADRVYKFTIQLPYQLGLGDVELEVVGKRTPEGRLEIEQRITNNTEPLEVLNFTCSLFVPGQIRQKQQVAKLGKGEDKKFYSIPWTDTLRGKELWLRAEQTDGRRVLNYRWKVVE